MKKIVVYNVPEDMIEDINLNIRSEKALSFEKTYVTENKPSQQNCRFNTDIFFSLNESTFKLLFVALVRPILENASPVWAVDSGHPIR